MYRAAPLVTAVLNWEDRIHGELFHGHLVVLYADGTVWEATAFQTREGGVTYSDGKKTQALPGLAQEFKKDWEGMGRHWRAMYRNRSEEYEVVSPLEIERLKKL